MSSAWGRSFAQAQPLAWCSSSMSLSLSVAALRHPARQGWRRLSRALLTLLFWAFLALWLAALALWQIGRAHV